MSDKIRKVRVKFPGHLTHDLKLDARWVRFVALKGDPGLSGWAWEIEYQGHVYVIDESRATVIEEVNR